MEACQVEEQVSPASTVIVGRSRSRRKPADSRSPSLASDGSGCDIAPKPLRIAKRRRSESPSLPEDAVLALLVGQDDHIAHFQAVSPVKLPHRQSLAVLLRAVERGSQGRAPSDCSTGLGEANIVLPESLNTPGNQYLQVRKQRRKNSTLTPSPQPTTSANKKRSLLRRLSIPGNRSKRARQHSVNITREESFPIGQDNHLQHSRVPARAVSMDSHMASVGGRWAASDRQVPDTHSPGLGLSSPRRIRSAGTQVDRLPVCQEMEEVEEQAEVKGNRRKGGFLRKLPFLSRPMDIFRSSSGQSDSGPLRQLLDGDRRESSSSSVLDKDIRSRSTTISTTGTGTSISTNSDYGAIRLSRSSEIGVTSEAEKVNDVRNLSSPRDRLSLQAAPLLMAHTTIVPEVAQLGEDDTDCIWVAVAITAELGRPYLVAVPGALPALPLDVVICVQWSILAPQHFLDECRQIATQVARALDNDQDRISIVEATAYPTTQLEESYNVLSQFRRVNVAHIQHTISSMLRPKYITVLPPGASENAIHYCTDLLLHAKASRSADGSNLSNYHESVAGMAVGHVILITSEVEPFSYASRDEVQVHVINPTYVSAISSLACDDGGLNSLDTPAECSKSFEGIQNMEIASRLRSLLNASRAGMLLGALLDVEIAVYGASDTQIVYILGNTRFDRLSPGQTARLHIKLRPGKAEFERLLHRNTAYLSLQGVTSQEMEAQLHTMLGKKVEELVHIDVSYRHAILSHETVLSTRQTGTIMRQMSNSVDGAHVTAKDLERRAQVHMWVAEHIATTFGPDEAPAMICGIHCWDDCSLSTRAARIAGALDHLYRKLTILPEQEDTEAHAVEIEQDDTSAMQGMMDNMSEVLEHPTTSMPAVATRDWARPMTPSAPASFVVGKTDPAAATAATDAPPCEPTSPYELASPSYSCPAQLESGKSEPEEEVVDEAHRIWTSIRQASKGLPASGPMTPSRDTESITRGMQQLSMQRQQKQPDHRKKGKKNDEQKHQQQSQNVHLSSYGDDIDITDAVTKPPPLDLASHMSASATSAMKTVTGVEIYGYPTSPCFRQHRHHYGFVEMDNNNKVSCCAIASASGNAGGVGNSGRDSAHTHTDGTSTGTGARGDSSANNDDGAGAGAGPSSSTAKAIMAQALRNKRSIGADTLQSLVVEAEGGGAYQHEASRLPSNPWL